MKIKYTLNDCHKVVEEVWKMNISNNLKKNLMDFLIWKITEINGKYKTKYRSKEAMNIKDTKKLHHEHVFSRKKLKEDLVNAKSLEEVRNILKKIEACIVTREEHKKLKNDIDGWERYKKANIEVCKVE